MPEYLSPGVYVEEIPSSIKPIAGVSTSTAAFLGVVPESITMLDENPNFDSTRDATDEKGANPKFFSWQFPVADNDAIKKANDDLATAIKARDAATADPNKFRDASKEV